jgi:type I restriction enzyme M protein
MNHSQIVSFIWGVADLIRDTFKRGKYQDVILPLTVLRRLDCVLAPTKAKVLQVQAKYKGKIENLDPQLRRASGFAFYNTSCYDFEKLLADAPHIAQNLRNYIAGFSPNMREVLEKFDFDNTISKLDEAGLLYQVVQRFGDPKVDLHPDVIDKFTMGTIFEELIRKFNEALNENPGEHFTPRDVVHLMVDLLLAGEERRLRKKGVVLSVYDPCSGSGGMLTIAKEHLTVGERREGTLCKAAVNPDADVHLFGQEVNPETFAVCLRQGLFGAKPVPSLKLASNSGMAHRMVDDIDGDCGGILEGQGDADGVWGEDIRADPQDGESAEECERDR